MKKTISIIIVNYNTSDLTIDCLSSIAKDKSIPPYEIILIDNASTDGSFDKFNELKWKNLVLVRNKENLGFAKAVNQGIKLSRGEYILLLNSDTTVKKGAIKKLIDFARRTKDVGVIVPRLLNADNSIQPSCFNLPSVSRAFKQYFLGQKGLLDKFYPTGKKPTVVESAVGAAFLITPIALKKVGLFDERYFMYFEDLDYCRRVNKKGLKVYYLPDSEIIHLHGQSGKNLASDKDQWKRLIPSSKIYYGTVNHYLINSIIRFSNLFRNKRGTILSVILLLLLVLPTISPLLRRGFFYMQDDLQAFRVQQMDKCFKDLQIPCRWIPDAGYGYGYPQFNYYPPLVYYLGELIHLLGFEFVDTVKILFVLGYLLSALSMFILLRLFAGNLPALVASLVYTYAPYKAVEVYVRGALSEFWAFVFFPLIFWSSYLLIKKGKSIYFVLLSLFLASLFTTHILMTISFFVPFLVWVLFWALHEKKVSSLFRVLLSGIFAFALSAFFVLPVAFERQYAHIETMTMGYFDYRKHFLGIYKLLFDREWGYGSSGFKDEKLNLSLGFVQWFFPLIFFLIFSFRKFILKTKKQSNYDLMIFIGFLLILFSLFIIHPRSIFIWENLPFLALFQFPWRFMTVALFLSAFVTGIGLTLFRRKSRLFLGILISVLAIFLNINYFRPRDWYFDIDDSKKFSGELWERQLTISIFDYLPIYATLPPWSKAPQFPEIIFGDAKILSYNKGSDYQIGEVVVLSDKARIRAPIFDFPGMVVLANGKTIPHFNNDCSSQRYCLGLVTFDLDYGRYNIEIRLKDTPVRKIANIISLVSFCAIIFLLVKGKYEQKTS